MILYLILSVVTFLHSMPYLIIPGASFMVPCRSFNDHCYINYHVTLKTKSILKATSCTSLLNWLYNAQYTVCARKPTNVFSSGARAKNKEDDMILSIFWCPETTRSQSKHAKTGHCRSC